MSASTATTTTTDQSSRTVTASDISSTTSTTSTKASTVRTATPAVSIFSQIALICDGLYLCAARGVSVRALNERGITLVINATTELPNLIVSGVEYVKVAVLDSPFENLAAHFDSVADRIMAERRAGGSTLVHCVAGVSRSASLVMAFLVKHEGLTLRDAYHHVREKRAIVRPNCAFFRQMIAYELQLTGRQTVELVSTAIGLIPDVYQMDYRNILLFSNERRGKNAKPKALMDEEEDCAKIATV